MSKLSYEQAAYEIRRVDDCVRMAREILEAGNDSEKEITAIMIYTKMHGEPTPTEAGLASKCVALQDQIAGVTRIPNSPHASPAPAESAGDKDLLGHGEKNDCSKKDL